MTTLGLNTLVSAQILTHSHTRVYTPGLGPFLPFECNFNKIREHFSDGLNMPLSNEHSMYVLFTATVSSAYTGRRRFHTCGSKDASLRDIKDLQKAKGQE